MAHFFCRLIGPRPTFPADMTDSERAVMQQHAQYWTGLMEAGTVLIFGPVMDPKGPFGMGVIDVADLEAAKKFADGDPVIKAGIGFTCDINPMRANMRGVQK